MVLAPFRSCDPTPFPILLQNYNCSIKESGGPHLSNGLDHPRACPGSPHSSAPGHISALLYCSGDITKIQERVCKARAPTQAEIQACYYNLRRGVSVDYLQRGGHAAQGGAAL